MIDKSKTNILVAEDSLAVAKLLQFRLEEAGFSVDAARDGRQALERAQRKLFDVVVTDEQMPVMSGRELCRHLRNNDRYASTPIIFLTAKRFELDLSELECDLRVSAVFGKPFSPNSLLQAIEAELAVARAARELTGHPVLWSDRIQCETAGSATDNLLDVVDTLNSWCGD